MPAQSAPNSPRKDGELRDEGVAVLTLFSIAGMKPEARDAKHAIERRRAIVD